MHKNTSDVVKGILNETKLYFERVIKKQDLSDNLPLFVEKINVLSAFAAFQDQQISDDQKKAIRFYTKNYLELFKNEKYKFHCIDVAICRKIIIMKNLDGSGDNDDVFAIIAKIREDAIGLKLGSAAECDSILLEISKEFACADVTLGEILEDIQRFVSLGLIESSKHYYQKYKDQINYTLRQDLFPKLFLAALLKDDLSYLKKVVKEFKITKLKELVIQMKSGEFYSPMSLISLIGGLEISPEEYFKFLVNDQKIHPDADKHNETFYSKLKGMTALLCSCNLGKLEITKELLKHGADINQIVEVRSASGELMTIRTPFSVAAGSGNIEFVRWLVEAGADPLKGVRAFQDGICIMHSMGMGQLKPKVHEKFMREYFKIIEDAFLQYISKNLERESSRKQLPEKSIEEHSVSENETQLDVNVSTDQLIKEYVSFKTARDDKTPEEELDLLLLRFCQKQTEEHLNTIHAHIEEHPELNCYLLTTLIQSGDEGVVSDVLMYQPRLLHEFFKLKKQQNLHSQEIVKDDIPKGLFEIRSTLTKKAFAAISEELWDQLNHVQQKKFGDLLTHGCNFIQEGKSGSGGIKLHKGLAKLKLPRQDESLTTSKKYVDEHGNTLFVFDRIFSHGDNYPTTFIETTKVTSLSELFLKIHNFALNEQVGLEEALPSHGLEGLDLALMGKTPDGDDS